MRRNGRRRLCDRAQLVTDDATKLRAQLQAGTGERIAALEGIGEMVRETPDEAAEATRAGEQELDRGTNRES